MGGHDLLDAVRVGEGDRGDIILDADDDTALEDCVFNEITFLQGCLAVCLGFVAADWFLLREFFRAFKEETLFLRLIQVEDILRIDLLDETAR